MVKKILLSFFILLNACSYEFKIEKSNAITRPLRSGNYYDFYLVNNYEEKEYYKIKNLSKDKFTKTLQTIDSLVYFQVVFYKKNWNTSSFLDSEDPYGHFSPMLQENDKKYGKYYIESFYYERIDNSNKWIYHSMKKNITDTIEVKINR